MFPFYLVPLLPLLPQSLAVPDDQHHLLLPLDVDDILPPDFMANFPFNEAIPNNPSPPFFLPETISFPTPLQIFQDTLEDAILDPRIRPVPPADPSHLGYEIDCSSGSLPPASAFPKSRPRSSYTSLTQVCSIYTPSSIPHLGCQCRNPGYGDWIICYGEPWGDGVLGVSLAMQDQLPDVHDLSVLDACYKHCKCKSMFDLSPSSDSEFTTTPSSDKSASPWTTAQTPDRDGSSESLSSSAYTITLSQQGVNIVIAQSINLLPSRATVKRLSALGLTPPGGWACSMSGGWNGTCPPLAQILPANGPKPENRIPLGSIKGVPPEAQPVQAPVCLATCDLRKHFACGSGCKCVASQIRGGLSHIAGCMSVVAVGRLMGQKGRKGGALGLVRSGLFGRRVETKEEEEGIRWGCPCNASYVSEGCCGSESGVLWEGKEMRMGALRV
ncbi:MAG: hypothetical protein M1814_004983 [Vezdaea aestivalis]|nr:MAG: hypothetical protein M1814_004983 [Vezdaea aestivalis]